MVETALGEIWLGHVRWLTVLYMWLAHALAKGAGDAKCRISFLPLNLMPQRFFYIHVTEQGIDS